MHEIPSTRLDLAEDGTKQPKQAGRGFLAGILALRSVWNLRLESGGELARRRRPEITASSTALAPSPSRPSLVIVIFGVCFKKFYSNSHYSCSLGWA
jgi:hypothetical protein